MALSFFRALNPTSKNSGIAYCIDNKEMDDSTVSENIYKAFKSHLDFLSGLEATFNILIGEHFDLRMKGNSAKGVLDFFLLPLIARKLIADSFLIERRDKTFINILAITIAAPIEIARFSASVVLTLPLAPIVALVHLIKTYLPKEIPNEGETNSLNNLNQHRF